MIVRSRFELDNEKMAAYQDGCTRTRARSESSATDPLTLLTRASTVTGTAPVIHRPFCGRDAFLCLIASPGR